MGSEMCIRDSSSLTRALSRSLSRVLVGYAMAAGRSPSLRPFSRRGSSQRIGGYAKPPEEPITTLIFLDVDGVLHAKSVFSEEEKFSRIHHVRSSPALPSFSMPHSPPARLLRASQNSTLPLPLSLSTCDRHPDPFASFTRILSHAPLLCAQLVTIVRATGASVVVDSSWREFPNMVRQLSDAMIAHGIAAPIDRTPSLLIGDRKKEIGAWLLENRPLLSPTLRWIAIDDCWLGGLGHHFVHTSSEGLTERDVCLAISLLRTGTSPSLSESDGVTVDVTPQRPIVLLASCSSLTLEDGSDDGEVSAALTQESPAPQTPQDMPLCGTVELKRVLSNSSCLDGKTVFCETTLGELEAAADGIDLPDRLPAFCVCTFCVSYTRTSSSKVPKSPLHRLARKYAIM